MYPPQNKPQHNHVAYVFLTYACVNAGVPLEAFEDSLLWWWTMLGPLPEMAGYPRVFEALHPGCPFL